MRSAWAWGFSTRRCRRGGAERRGRLVPPGLLHLFADGDADQEEGLKVGGAGLFRALLGQYGVEERGVGEDADFGRTGARSLQGVRDDGRPTEPPCRSHSPGGTTTQRAAHRPARLVSRRRLPCGAWGFSSRPRRQARAINFRGRRPPHATFRWGHQPDSCGISPKRRRDPLAIIRHSRAGALALAVHIYQWQEVSNRET